MIKMDWDELEWKPSCCIFKLPSHNPLPMTKKKNTPNISSQTSFRAEN